MPPSSWPTTLSGLRAMPTSWAVATCTTRTMPRSMSTSTTARCTANANAVCTSPWPFSSSPVVGGWRYTSVAAKRRPAVKSFTGRRSEPAVSTIASTSMASRSTGTACSSATAPSNWERTASHAVLTAPPLIQVWRDALVEPAEPISVSMRSSTTSSTPRTLRAIWPARVTKPCPTSAVANFSVATPSASTQPAVEKSSNPSEYMRFLIDAA